MKSAEALPLGHLQCILLMMCVYIFQMSVHVCISTISNIVLYNYIVMIFIFYMPVLGHLSCMFRFMCAKIKECSKKCRQCLRS